MAEKKDSSMELKPELESMSDLDMELGLNNDNSADMVELKNRMDKTDQEMRAMTEAMKSTLLDVRSLMQDMDNPFNMLRDMGVDKLVNKAVETVEDEVNKQKREDAKKRLADDGEEEADKPSLVKVESAAASQQAHNPTVYYESDKPEPMQAPVVRNEPQIVQQPVDTGIQYQTSIVSHDSVPTQVKQVQTPVAVNTLYLEERIAQTENSVNQLTGTVNELVKVIRESNKRKPTPQTSYIGLENEMETGQYYEAYVSLVSDYLQVRLGDKGSEEVLLEGMYKEWASPKVVRDVMEKLSSSRKQGKKSPGVGLSGDVEDKMLITSLLRNLDKPVSEWGESTHLFLLLALVSRARENQGNRS